MTSGSINVHNSVFFSPLSPSPSHARSCHTSGCEVKSCRGLKPQEMQCVCNVCPVCHVCTVCNVCHVCHVCHVLPCEVMSCAAVSCSCMCINTCSGSVILWLMIRCFGYLCKRTWLMLGGDPAARSHRVEQFNALGVSDGVIHSRIS